MINASKKIFLIEDDVSLRMAISTFLTREGYQVKSFESAEEALPEIAEGACDLILSDVMMPGKSGYDLLEEVMQKTPSTPFILMTAYGTIEKAVAAMKKGAYDFLVKPFHLNILSHSILSAFTDQSSQIRKIEDKTLPKTATTLLTKDPAMLDIINNLKKVASSKATVVLQGESGTGKEVLAQMLHEFSPRALNPFVGINCAALPDNLLESELFGHEKGSFTGAVNQQIGKFEASNNGTILLDEITEMSLSMQTKLLRVLQECEIYRVGGVKPIPLNLRVVATTNRNLHQYVADGHFREDLYYRINVVAVHVPPLRDRGDDSVFLAETFLKEFSETHQRPLVTLNENTRQLIKNSHWSGNVRELRNVMERATLTGNFENLFKPAVTEVSQSATLPENDLSLRDVEKKFIIHTLNSCAGNRTKAAEKLGISLRTLRNKLKEYRMEDGNEDE